MPIDKIKLTNAMLIKAANCETADELVALARTEGMEITTAEAEAYLSELDNVELDSKALEKVAGGYNLCENYGQACPSYINVG